MFSETKIITIFCKIDDFCKAFLPSWEKKLIPNQNKRNTPSKLSHSEVITLMVLFHESGFREFKKFYTGYVSSHMNSLFPNLVSYNRMVELISDSIIPMAIDLKKQALGECNGISFIDSTPLRVCHKKRIHQHKVFDGLAQRGKCSIGWFYGFKLHIITIEIGEIIDIMITPGNVDDRKPLKYKGFIKKLWGKLFGDKGYIGKDLFESLIFNGIHLVTKLKKNMKSQTITPAMDAIMLRKRAICETIIDQLKNIFLIEHSRHRNPKNFLANLFSALIAYNFSEKKPSIMNQFVDTKQLLLNF